MFAIGGRFDEFHSRDGLYGGECVNHDDASVAEGALPDVAARLALIEARIERPLTEEQRDEVRARIARSIALGVAMRAYPLTNADEPEIALVPFRGDDR